eukprot:SM000130S27098  [mRNA]  locus=s130:182127:183180:- [translate_table: standard]
MATEGSGAAPVAVYGGGYPLPQGTAELPPYAAAAPPSAPQEPASGSEPPRGGGGERRPKYERRRGGDTCCDFLWRFLQLAAAVCAFSVTIASNTGRLRFQNMATTTYLVVGTVIAASWALFMLHVDLVLLAVGLSVHSRSYHLAVFLLDFVAATIALTAGSALAGLATFEVHGNYAYPQTLCQGATPFDRWCSRIRAGAALAILAFAFFLPSLAIDIRDLGKEVREETEEAK